MELIFFLYYVSISDFWHFLNLIWFLWFKIANIININVVFLCNLILHLIYQIWLISKIYLHLLIIELLTKGILTVKFILYIAQINNFLILEWEISCSSLSSRWEELFIISWDYLLCHAWLGVFAGASNALMLLHESRFILRTFCWLDDTLNMWNCVLRWLNKMWLLLLWSKCSSVICNWLDIFV